MTKDQLATAKVNRDKIVTLYTRVRNKQVARYGYVLEMKTNMLAWTKKALKIFFREPIEVSWDEACEIFER